MFLLFLRELQPGEEYCANYNGNFSLEVSN